MSLKHSMSIMGRKVAARAIKAAPTVAFVVGGIGTCVAIVSAIKATKNEGKDIIENHQKTIETIKAYREENQKETAENSSVTPYTDKEYRSDIVRTYAKTGIDLTKTYGKTIMIETVSLGLMTGSFVTLNARNVKLAALAAATSKQFNDAMTRLRDEYGEEVERKIRYGVEKKTVPVEVEDEDGNTKFEEKEMEVVEQPLEYFDRFSRFFDASSRNWTKNAYYNWCFLSSALTQLNNQLNEDGFVFLNDVYKLLDIPLIPDGQKYGWLKEEGPISFGFSNVAKPKTRDFVNGYENVYLVTFNQNPPRCIIDEI